MRKLQNSGSSIFHRPAKAKWHKLQHLQSFTFKLHRSQVTLCSPCVHHVFTMCSPCVHHVHLPDTVRLRRRFHSQNCSFVEHPQPQPATTESEWTLLGVGSPQLATKQPCQNQQVRPAREMPGRCQLPRKLATHIPSIGKASLPQSPEAGEAGEALRTFTSNIIHYSIHIRDRYSTNTQHLFNTADWVRRNAIAGSRGLKMFEVGPVYSHRRWSRANPGKPRW